MATKSQEILLKGNTTNASAVPSSLKVREIAINALDRSLFTNDGNSIVKLYTGTTKWFDVNGNANNALKLGGVLASEYINKEAFNSHINNSTIHITANERTAWNNKWDYNEDTIKAVKVNAAVSADKLTSDEGTSAIPIYFKNGKPAQCIPSDLFSGFDNAYSSTETSLGITIAGHTRMVVVAYSTLAGSATKLETARTLWGKPFDGSANVDGDLKDVGNITASGKATIQGDIISGGEVAAIVGEGTPAGVTDYSALTGKPSINGVTLVSGNNTLVSLGIQPAGDYATNSGVTTLLANYADKTFVSNNYVGKTAFNNHTADTDIHITASERVAWNAKWTYDEATIKAVKVTSASSADSVAWTGISGKPTTFTPSAHTHTASDVTGLPTKLSAFNNDVGYITGITKLMVEGVLTGDITSHTHSYLPLSGGTITHQIYGGFELKRNEANYDSVIKFSNVSDGLLGYIGISGSATTAAPKVPYYSPNGTHIYLLLHSGNYNSYAPTLTGTGASGTWGINISGNAATATNASNASNANTLAGYNESFFFRFRGNLYQNHDYNANNLGIGEYVFRSSGYGNVGTGNQHINALGENSTIQVFNNLQLSTIAWDNSVAYRVNWSGETNSSRPYSWSPWIYFLSTDNYNSYAPTLTGTGASGTWGISISGNAASADYATSAGLLKLVANQNPDTSSIGQIFATSYNEGIPSGGYAYFSGITLASNNDANYKVQLGLDYYGKVFSRWQNAGTWQDWNRLAFITDNVASATKLQTPRTIWGQSFDGTGSVSGHLIGVTYLTFNSTNTHGFYKGSVFSSGLTENDLVYSAENHCFYNGNSYAFTIKNNGNILIGTTTDNGYKLQVNGAERVYGDLIVDGEVSALVA